MIYPAAQLAILSAAGLTVKDLIAMKDEADKERTAEEFKELALETGLILGINYSWPWIVRQQLLLPIWGATLAALGPYMFGLWLSDQIDSEEGVENYHKALNIYLDPTPSSSNVHNKANTLAWSLATISQNANMTTDTSVFEGPINMVRPKQLPTLPSPWQIWKAYS